MLETTKVRRDTLGLRRVLGDRLLPVMVAAMAFLAALALGGATAAQALADRWRLGAGTVLTAQVPRPADPATTAAQTRLEATLSLLRGSPAIVSAGLLSDGELDQLLAPWLGGGASVPRDLLPAVIAVRASTDPTVGVATFEALAEAIGRTAPGASLEAHAAWIGRLTSLLRALEACGWGALLVVVGVAALVIAAATRAGLLARRTTVDILHGLGATDGYVATRFARRAMGLAATGGLVGMAAALPVLLALARLAQPFSTRAAYPQPAAGLPMSLWVGLSLLPAGAAVIGYATAQGTVRLWLRRLP